MFISYYGFVHMTYNMRKLGKLIFKHYNVDYQSYLVTIFRFNFNHPSHAFLTNTLSCKHLFTAYFNNSNILSLNYEYYSVMNVKFYRYLINALNLVYWNFKTNMLLISSLFYVINRTLLEQMKVKENDSINRSQTLFM